MIDDAKLRAAVERMFEHESPFHKVANANWLYTAVIDGVRVGVILATHNAAFANYSLNCDEFNRAKDAKTSGRVDAVYVVKTRYDTGTGKRRVIEVIEATGLAETLRHAMPREGRHGPFFTLGGSEGEDFIM